MLFCVNRAWYPALLFILKSNFRELKRVDLAQHLRKNISLFSFSFGSGTHAGIPGEPTDIAKFDGKGGVLSHAYYPSDGRIHFDEDEKWSTEGKEGGWWVWIYWKSMSLIYLATHEIGHAIGLGHSNDVNSVMLPTVDLGNPSLATDDVNGVNALYTCK